MAGRNSAPMQLVKAEGNKNRLTKEEMKHREKGEKALQTGQNFKEEPATKKDPFAHKEFLRLKKLYKEIEYVEALDQGIINRYCQLKSQDESLKNLYAALENDLDEAESAEERMKVFDGINSVMGKQNQIRGMMLKLEDRLFLNPTSRIRSIPKNPEDTDKDSPMKQFLRNRRGS